MKHLVIGSLLSLLFVIFVSAQPSDVAVDSINKRYQTISQKARLCETDDEQGEYGELVMNTLTINSRGHQWRAVGTYGQTFKFFYRSVENDEKRLYPDELVFVKVERKVSNRSYTEEYLFSDRGALMFYKKRSENDDQTPREITIHFLGVRPIKIAVDGAMKIRLSQTETNYSIEARRNAAQIKEQFERSIKL